MKTRILQLLAIMILASILTGCASFPEKLKQLDAAGIQSVEISGKFSHTKYTKEEKDGVVTSTLEHSNAWIPAVKVTRVVKADAAK